MNLSNLYHALDLANPWWKNKPVPKQFNPPFKRPQLETIMSYEKLDRIIVIKGPRRTGKTTLIYQYISKLLKKGVDPKSILFASMDDLNLRTSIQQIIDAYKTVILPSTHPKKLYLFLDEIQFLPKWSSMAKIITDRDKSIQLLVSGSSASLLNKDTESLTGRTVEETILPFTIKEIISLDSTTSKTSLADWKEDQPIKSLPNLTFKKSSLLYKQKLTKYMYQFLKRGGFPHLFNVKEESLWLNLLRTDIIQKAIYKDLSELYSIKQPLILEKLFLYLTSTTSEITNLSSISGQLKISRETLNSYIKYLTNAYLIFSLPKYSNYPKEILKSQEKLHIIDPAFNYLVGDFSQDRILETVVAGLLLRQKNSKLYYWRRNFEVDCVVEINRQLIPIEVKNSNRPFQATNYRGLLNFMKKYSNKSKLGFIIHNGEPDEIKIGSSIIRLLPAWYFLSSL
ncbi:MAG: ATP-binding protein [Patescibacteria group bacterium]|nr:ATP-binding protein [Patescibacteria group bacterium]